MLISRKLPQIINNFTTCGYLFFTSGFSFNIWTQMLVLKWRVISFYRIFNNDSANSITCHFATAYGKVIVYGHNLKIKLF